MLLLNDFYMATCMFIFDKLEAQKVILYALIGSKAMCYIQSNGESRGRWVEEGGQEIQVNRRILLVPRLE